MKVPAPIPSLTLDAVAEATSQAAAYAQTATTFAELGDARGLLYAIRCAAAALQTAASMAEDLRPPAHERRRAC